LVNKLQQTNKNNRTDNFADYFSSFQKQSMVCELVDAYEQCKGDIVVVDIQEI